MVEALKIKINEGAKTTNKPTGKSMTVEELAHNERFIQDGHHLMSSVLWDPRSNITESDYDGYERLNIRLLSIEKSFWKGYSMRPGSVIDTVLNFITFIVAAFATIFEAFAGFTFTNSFVRKSVATVHQVVHHFMVHTECVRGQMGLQVYWSKSFGSVIHVLVGLYYAFVFPVDVYSIVLGLVTSFALDMAIRAREDNIPIMVKMVSNFIAFGILAPLCEEYTRFGYQGALVVFGEILPRLVTMFFMKNIRDHFVVPDPTWNTMYVAWLQTFAMHLLLFILPLPFWLRFVIHACQNIYAMHFTFHKELYGTKSWWACDSGANLSRFSVMDMDMDIHDIVRWYNYFISKKEWDAAKQIMSRIDYLDHGQMFSYFSSIFDSNPVLGSALPANHTMGGLIDAIKKMKIALPVHVKHEIGFSEDTLETLKTLAWLGATTVLVEAMVRKDMPGQTGYTETLGKLAVIGGVLGLLNLDKLQNTINSFFKSTAQTTDINPVNLLIDGAGMFLFGSIFSTTPHTSITKLLSDFSMIGKSITGATSFMQKLVTWVQDLILYVCSCFGVEVRMANGPYTERIEQMNTFLERINAKEESGAQVSFKEIDTLKLCIKELDEMFRNSTRNNISAVTRTYLTMMTKRFQGTLLRVDRPDTKLGHRDKAPWSVHIVGPPGTGKSDAVKMLGDMFVKRTLPVSLRDDYEKNPTLYRPYSKGVSDKFYSGLKNNCQVVVLSDCFQATDKEGDVESEANAFIHLHSAELMAAAQAVAELKGYIFLNPIVSISDSNWLGQGDGPKSTKEKGAIIRRANRFCHIQCVIPGYRKPNPAVSYKLACTDLDDDGHDAYTSMLDPEKSAVFIQEGGDPAMLWQYRRWDMVTVAPAADSKWMTFYEFIDACLDNFDQYWTRGADAVRAFAPCVDRLSRLAFARAEALAVESPVIQARPQTNGTEEYEYEVTADISDNRNFNYEAIRSAVHGGETEDLYPHELNIVEFIQAFSSSLLVGDLLEHLEMIAPMVLKPKFRSICDLAEFEYKNLPECLLITDVVSIKHTFLTRMERMADSYCRSWSKVTSQLPDSYFSLDFLSTKFKSLPVVTMKRGLLTCGVLTTLFAAYYYFTKQPVEPTPVTSTAQTVSNLTNTEMYINKYTANQLFMMVEVIPHDVTKNVKYVKPLNYVTMLRDTCGVTVEHCFKEARYYHGLGTYTVNLLLYSFDNISRDEDSPNHRVPFSSVKLYETSIVDIILVDFGLSIKKYCDLYQHLPSKSQLTDLISKENQYEIHYMVKPDELPGQHAISSGYARVSSSEYAVGIAFRCFFTGEMVVPGSASVVLQKYCLSSTLNRDGTCGVVTFVHPSSAMRKSNPKYNQPVPVAIHVSGAKVGLEGHEAIIYKEAFQFAFEGKGFIPPTDNYTDLKEYYAGAAVIAARHGLKSEAIPPVLTRDVAHEPMPIGQKHVADVVKVNPPLKTAIVPSKFKDAIESVLCLDEPLRTANLSYKRMEDGNYATVVAANSLNYGRNPGGSISVEALNTVSTYYINSLKFKIEGRGDQYRAYSTLPINLRSAYEAVIRGGEGNNGVRYSVLDRTKSIGSTLQFVTDVKSRHDIFGTGYFPEMGSPAELMLWEMVSDIHQKILSGQSIVAIYKAMPKDELLPKSKAAVKTRLFSVGDLALLMLNMIYFRDLVAVMKASRSRTGYMVGINPYDTEEWSNLAHNLRKFDGRCAMLDLSKFDMSVSTLLLEEFKKAAKSIIGMMQDNSVGDFSQDRLVADALLDKLTDFVMLYDQGGKSSAVHFGSTIPSGHYLTSLIGTYVNGLTGFCAKVAAKLDNIYSTRLTINTAPVSEVIDACKFVDEHTFTSIYGDDSGYSTRYAKLFSVATICSQMQLLFGMIATNESEGQLTLDENGFVPVDSDSRIIGRGFYYNPIMGKYLAPLRPSSLVKSIAFDKTDQNIEIKRNKYDAFLREASLHGFEFHHKIVKAVREVSRVELAYASPYEDYDLALTAVTSGLYVPEWEQDMEAIPQSSGKVARALGIATGVLFKHALAGCGNPVTIIPSGVRLVQPAIVYRTSEKYIKDVDKCNIVKCTYYSGGCSPGFVAQSSSSAAMEGLIGSKTENTQHVTSVICTDAGATCFEDGAAIKSHHAGGAVISGVPDLRETIGEFLSRPQLIGSGAWTTSSTAGSFQFSVSQIGSYLTSGDVNEVSVWTDKIKGYTLCRGTFIVRFVLNASKFMQGSLLHFFMPNYAQYLLGNVAPKFANFTQQMQLQHVLMTTEDTVVEFDIPFMGPYGWHVLGTGSNVGTGNVDWGTFNTTVLTPLKVGPNALVTNADWQVYGYWKDFEVAAPSIPQMSGKRAKGKVIDKDVIDKPISGTLSKISVASNALSGVPMIGSFMNNLSWVSGILSGAASAFGYSKPFANSHYMIVNQQPLKYIATSDGTDAAVPLGLIADNKTEFLTDLSTTGEDEMDLRFLYSRVHFTDSIEWNTSATSGASLLSKYISPANLHGSVDSALAGAATFVYGGPMYYLGNIFQYWRGSVVMNIKIIKTAIHTGRLMIVFTPKPHTNIVVAPTLTNSTWSLREIIDIRTQDEISLTLPYMVATDYLPVRPTLMPNPFVNASGRLDVYVLNELRCSETVASSVDLIVTFTAGPDFEMQVPTRAQYVTNNIGVQTGSNLAYTAVPFIPQSSSAFAVALAIAQSSSDSKIIEAPIGDSVVPAMSVGPSTRCIGEFVTSVKQLICRNSTGYFLHQTALRSALVNPYDIISCSLNTSGTLITPERNISYAGILWGDMYAYIADMYMYYKGSMIVDYYNGSSNGIYASLVIDPAVSTPFYQVGPFDNATAAATTSNSISFSPTATPVTGTLMSIGNASGTSRYDSGIQSFVVPYYNSTRCAYVGNKKSATPLASGDPFRAKGAIQLSAFNSTVASNGRVSRRCADDFQFAQFLSCPPLLTRAP